ncbi:hypothetical protein XENOCAPTIV_012029 [Xenoophorus captivus]|uniref:Uncharacterized protein n=1 Tax=Xenoophorus captivus TaxID=1517983 RepID=A0ABV0RWH7_9TELE
MYDERSEQLTLKSLFKPEDFFFFQLGKLSCRGYLTLVCLFHSSLPVDLQNRYSSNPLWEKFSSCSCTESIIDGLFELLRQNLSQQQHTIDNHYSPLKMVVDRDPSSSEH